MRCIRWRDGIIAPMLYMLISYLISWVIFLLLIWAGIDPTVSIVGSYVMFYLLKDKKWT